MTTLKRCVICRAAYYPKRDWQKTCGSAECRAEHNRRRMRESYTPKAELPVDEYQQPMCEPQGISTEGAINLSMAIFESAWREKDRHFFHTPLARMIADTAGADLRAAYQKMIGGLE